METYSTSKQIGVLLLRLSEPINRINMILVCLIKNARIFPYKLISNFTNIVQFCGALKMNSTKS